eukprot:scaffold119129_cov31-Tisochrysis_lutea.AAC.1
MPAARCADVAQSVHFASPTTVPLPPVGFFCICSLVPLVIALVAPVRAIESRWRIFGEWFDKAFRKPASYSQMTLTTTNAHCQCVVYPISKAVTDRA